MQGTHNAQVESFIFSNRDFSTTQQNVYAEEELTPIFSHNYKQKMAANKMLNNKKYEDEDKEEEEKRGEHFGSKSQTKNLKSSNFPVFRSLQPVSRILKNFKVNLLCEFCCILNL